MNERGNKKGEKKVFGIAPYPAEGRSVVPDRRDTSRHILATYGSVVSFSFFFHHLSEDDKEWKIRKKMTIVFFFSF